MRLARLLAFLLAAFGFASVAQAQLTFQLRTGDAVANVQSMPIDSNNCAGSGPRAMYVGGVITNTGGTTVTNIVATISGPPERSSRRCPWLPSSASAGAPAVTPPAAPPKDWSFESFRRALGLDQANRRQ